VLTETDVHLFHEGRLFEAHRSFGAHPDPRGGTRCTVWAPNARSVAVVSDANGWDADAGRLERVTTGVWTGTDRRLATGHRYKFRIVTAEGTTVDKADPFALGGEGAPGNASIVADLSHAWGDEAWMAARGPRQQLRAPMAIYEVHLGSWRRPGGEAPNYAAIAPDLAEHVVDLGFTHVELLPVMEHPFYGSWGYQTTGYFAPTARYGDPRDLMRMIDHLHQRGIGVILDWVPSHFPTDAFGLARFDGTPLFESEDQGLHPDWNTLQFDYARPEVRSFLVSSARHWLDRYHVDGIRVDAVASMLYLDYSRGPGEWRPNVHGGNENLDAIAFLRELNTEVYRAHPDVQTFAEESTAFPGVSRPVHAGGLGFGAKWDMGWMHDTLDYLARDPVHRGHHHGEVTFRTVYAWSEHFVLPLSHDEVVHGKGSLLTKMPGDRWQQLANLRMLLGMQYAQPGRKLLFMGTELAPETEWDHERALDWSDLGRTDHAGISAWLRDLNAAYRARPALYERDDDPGAFQWIEHDDAVESVFTFLRWDEAGTPMLVAINATPVVRHDHVVGVPAAGPWVELLNSDAETYGGSGVGNLGAATAGDAPAHGFAHSVALTLPPLAIVFLTPGPARPAASRPARP
jgi:1,4-alpha-glucan branching enzyme